LKHPRAEIAAAVEGIFKETLTAVSEKLKIFLCCGRVAE
jgi:hypothetical protein